MNKTILRTLASHPDAVKRIWLSTKRSIVWKYSSKMFSEREVQTVIDRGDVWNNKRT